MHEPRPDWSPLGVNLKILDEHPHLFYILVPLPPPGIFGWFAFSLTYVKNLSLAVIIVWKNECVRFCFWFNNLKKKKLHRKPLRNLTAFVIIRKLSANQQKKIQKHVSVVRQKCFCHFCPKVPVIVKLHLSLTVCQVNFQWLPGCQSCFQNQVTLYMRLLVKSENTDIHMVISFLLNREMPHPTPLVHQMYHQATPQKKRCPPTQEGLSIATMPAPHHQVNNACSLKLHENLNFNSCASFCSYFY